MNRNKEYLQALDEAKLYHPQPEGLTNIAPTSQTDSLVIKQNNTIIILLLQVLQKLENLINKPESSKTRTKEEIENLIKGFDDLEITKPLSKKSKIPKYYTFGTLIKPEKPKDEKLKEKE